MYTLHAMRALWATRICEQPITAATSCQPTHPRNQIPKGRFERYMCVKCAAIVLHTTPYNGQAPHATRMCWKPPGKSTCQDRPVAESAVPPLSFLAGNLGRGTRVGCGWRILRGLSPRVRHAVAGRTSPTNTQVLLRKSRASTALRLQKAELRAWLPGILKGVATSRLHGLPATH